MPNKQFITLNDLRADDETVNYKYTVQTIPLYFKDFFQWRKHGPAIDWGPAVLLPF